MTKRGELVLAVSACAAAAGLTFVAAGRAWAGGGTGTGGAGGSTGTTGGDLVPALSALALVALAGAGALLATRGFGRLVVGVALVLTGSGLAVATLEALPAAGGGRVGWPVACAAAGVVIVVIGAVAARRGREWPSMGTRYERRTAPGDSDRALWDALDRGEDPTA